MKTRILAISIAVAVIGLFLSSCKQKHYEFGILDFDYSPFTNIGENNKPEGICIELIEAIAEIQGFTYELKPYSLTGLYNAVNNGEVNAAIAPITITDENRLKFDYTFPFYETGLVFIKSPENTEIMEVRDLEGKSAVVLENTNIERYLRDHNDIWKLAKIETRSSNDAIIEDLLYNKVDVAFMEKPHIEYNISQGLMFEIIPGVFDKSSFANLVKKNTNQEVYRELNDGLAKIINNGTYTKIIKKYYL